MLTEKFARRCLLWLACFTAGAMGAAGAAEAPARAFFSEHCLRCHGEKQPKGEFRVDTLPSDFTELANAQRWAEVLFRINSREMPPKKEPQPTAAELGKTVDWISTRLKEGEAVRMAKRGPVAHYRLSREEYANTIYDLLGVYYDVNLPGAFNEDPRWHGFERIGAMLSLSPSHVDRYFRAAEIVLERAFPEQPVKATKGRRDANERREKWMDEQGITNRVRWPMWPGNSRHALSTTQPGTYRVRIQLSGLASFALRRAMTVDDAAQIKTIAAASKSSGHNLRGVIEQFVGSELFLKR